MPRPVKPRIVENMPLINYFKPAGIPMRDLKEVVLSVDEFEALRLKDMEKFEQHTCAERMGIAQSTFQRIITAARHKVITCLVEGKALRIEGGKFDLAADYICHRCQRRFAGKTNQDKKPEEEMTAITNVECPECNKN